MDGLANVLVYVNHTTVLVKNIFSEWCTPEGPEDNSTLPYAIIHAKSFAWWTYGYREDKTYRLWGYVLAKREQ